MPQVVLFLRILVGAVFLMSGLTKLAAPRQFASDVRQYRIVPTPLSDAFAYPKSTEGMTMQQRNGR